MLGHSVAFGRGMIRRVLVFIEASLNRSDGAQIVCASAVGVRSGASDGPAPSDDRGKWKLLSAASVVVSV